MARLALVTGASSGIGEAYAERLAGDGWDLVVVARRYDRLDALARRLAGDYDVHARAIAADLADEAQLNGLLAEVAEIEVSLVVNNAALSHYMPLADLPLETAQSLVDLNVLAPVLVTRSVVPGMIERGEGAIVNVASLLAFSGDWDNPQLPRRAVYAARKSQAACALRTSDRSRNADAGRAAGLNVGAILSGLNRRCRCSALPTVGTKGRRDLPGSESLGNNLLSAMEKEDVRRYPAWAKHERVIMEMVEHVRYAQLQEAIKSREGLLKSLGLPQRYTYYERQLGKKADEIKAIPD